MKIVIVGGGSAGWITASYLASTVEADVTIIHTDLVETIGVGESTTPTIQHIAKKVGIDEPEWMKQCEATFKYGVEFNDWNRIGSRWLHTFDDIYPFEIMHSPLQDLGKYNAKIGRTSCDYFLSLNKGSGKSREYNDLHGPGETLLERGLSPYDHAGRNTITNFPGYSFHVNAHKFGQAMKNACKFPITEIQKKVMHVNYNEDGVESIVLEDGDIIQGDVYFDCTGFQRLLIGELTDWNSYYPTIPNNRAIAGTAVTDIPFKPCTQAFAQQDGWIWKIPTTERWGSGFVYSSDFTTDDEAEERIVKFYADQGIKYMPVRRIKFDAGRCNEVAVKNVIANGLSQSFIEPLEATSLMITCSTARSFEELYNKNHTWNASKSKALSRFMHRIIDHNKRFVYYHYILSERQDSEYWRNISQGHDAVQEVCDYADSFKSDRWCEQGETKFNRFNLISMILGFEKTYCNELEDISAEDIEDYEFFKGMSKKHYEHLIRNNLTVDEYIDKING
ncbi:MAG: hypothetical protein CBE00_08375 [Planctomycetaceae bacterium TMED240]|nr:MAG: hypothetical protein CBE00_08375 [Planctomycetaceae bacterium TMED240]